MPKIRKAQKAIAKLYKIEKAMDKAHADYFKQLPIAGAALRESRVSNGISLRAAARALFISPGYLVDIEKGRRGIPTKVIEFYAKL